MDGDPVRTEAGFKMQLRKHKHMVRQSEAHGANQCLIDSIILALSHAGLTKEDFSVPHRAALCMRVRTHLVKEHGASQKGYLGHDDQAKNIFEYLRSHEENFWHDEAHPPRIQCTLIVYDRFTCREELTPTEPVFIPAVEASSPGALHVQLSLYCCTGMDGRGYHYECIHGT